ncbi:hypothetical protein [Stenotrophomonas sp. 364]|jgi:hypothetical protein|uniref:hypothetical protein n=1 Tax=Stenotrophomonas sp. 364 TaxID=2691571 RepID=UPI0013162D9E|nr:hypothetical protein [Stenotrophomonas sp. 364]QHB71649.1 hypothetical protein GQ674_10205 [Stenotrophomonas sp. 364]
MSSHRLIVHQHGVLLGHFDSAGPQARHHLHTLATQLPAAAGFQLQWQQAIGEQRLLSSGPAGLKVLGSEVVYQDIATPVDSG